MSKNHAKVEKISKKVEKMLVKILFSIEMQKMKVYVATRVLELACNMLGVC